ncbi:hypothetical protein PSTT_05384 [Puccinia striiformis]|uniref:Uncharacterized protein n=1 Tax=Puccinia striiformis TaxID=27350 RepID=A0A2S4VNX4_9BASI|nr:hypothetical protein PSTT_05384 [Puccinia striiformis]
MISCTDLQSGGVIEQLNYDEPKLDSKVLRLMITADTPHREEDGSARQESQQSNHCAIEYHGFFYSITGPRSSSDIPWVWRLCQETQSESSTETRSSSEPTPGLIQFQPVHQNSSSAKLCRKKSEKGRRSISALVIEAGKNEPWCAGFGKKTFTPACPLDCTASPLCMLSSSTSGSSTHSRTLKTRQAKHDGSTEMEIMRQVDQRCSSTTHIHIPEPSSLRSMSTSSSHSPDTSFEVVSRSNFTQRKTSSSRHSESLSRSIVGNTTPT